MRIIGADFGVREHDDAKNREILASRVKAFDQRLGPRVGDWIYFADGAKRRITHIWHHEDDTPEGAQTTPGTGDAGSFYFDHAYCSYSGGLETSTPCDKLTLTTEKRDGLVWFFHHDHHCAHNAVQALISFRVYTTTENAP